MQSSIFQLESFCSFMSLKVTSLCLICQICGLVSFFHSTVAYLCLLPWCQRSKGSLGLCFSHFSPFSFSFYIFLHSIFSFYLKDWSKDGPSNDQIKWKDTSVERLSALNSFSNKFFFFLFLGIVSFLLLNA